MRIILTININKIAGIRLNENNLKDPLVIKSFQNFSEKISEAMYKWLNDFKIKGVITYEIQKD